MSSPCPEPEQLLAFILGKLPESACDSIAAHLDHCACCVDTATVMDRTSDTLLAELCSPGAQSKYIEEPQCQEALRKVKNMAGGPLGPKPSPHDSGVADGISFGPSGIAAAIAPYGEGGKTDGILGRLGEYELLAKLGEGGMGTVYKARHVKLGKIVALKVLSKDRMANQNAIARFEREMKAIGRLEHANIVQAYDAREIDGIHFLVIQYVAGKDLGQIAGRCGPLPIADACELIRQAAVGLQYAHENGLVHRDIKPSNLILTILPSHSGSGTRGEGVVKILDLGLALLQAEHTSSDEMTGAGEAMGTAEYMAPEQVTDSHSVDIRADIYGLGCTLYKLLTGRPPFSGPNYRTVAAKLVAHVTDAATPVRE